MWKPNDPRWLIPGGLFTLLVVGLLMYLHLSNAETVPKQRQWTHEKSIYVCEAPKWVEESFEEALDLVKPWVRYSAVMRLSGSCADAADVDTSCTYGDRTVPCVTGATVVTTADQHFDFGDMEEGGHGDETLAKVEKETGNIVSVTILFPEDLQSIRAVGPNLELADWPPDVQVLVIAHALLHAEGYDHVVNDLPGPFYAEPTGHIMARSIGKLGRSTEGL